MKNHITFSNHVTIAKAHDERTIGWLWSAHHYESSSFSLCGYGEIYEASVTRSRQADPRLKGDLRYRFQRVCMRFDTRNGQWEKLPYGNEPWY